MNHSRWRNTEKLLFIFAFILVNALAAFAGPSRTTYQAKIVKPDGYPLEAANVNFKFTILDPAGSCILYSETYSSVNMTSTGGLISFALGSGVKTYPVSTTTFEQVFSNVTPSLTCDTGGPANYVPGADDIRKIVMQFHDGNGWQTLPAMAINAVPYAMYANDAQKLNGKSASDFVQVSTLASCGVSEALRYNGASFSCVAVDTGAGVTSGSVTTALGYTPANGASVTALSSSLATTNSNVAAVSSSVGTVASDVFAVSSTVASLSTSVSNLASTVSGVSTSVSGLSASMAALVSSQWEANGAKISYNSGFVGIGTSSPMSALELVSSTASIHVNLQGADNAGASVRYFSKRGSSGETLGSSNPSADNKGWSVGSIGDQNPASTRRNNFEASYWNGTVWSVPLVITASGSVGIGGTTVPVTKLDVSGGLRISMETAACAVALAGTLRYNSGTVEYCNGTSWQPFGVAGAGITNVNGSTSGSQTFATGNTGTAFNIATANGVHTFNIPNAASGAVTSGLLSNADYVIFSNKLSATSAAVISALGFIPANNAASGSYVVKANNLSDLTSSATARTNLGLGTLSTLSFLDLGLYASGTLAAARLPAFSGDATSSIGSSVLTLASVGAGVTSGSQYTKVTVDGKGRVVSGSQLSSSDVTTALGFTPASASAATQWTTSGSTIFYNTGNVGVGTSAPLAKFEISDGAAAWGSPKLLITNTSAVDQVFLGARAASTTYPYDWEFAGIGSTGAMQIRDQLATTTRIILNRGTSGSIVLQPTLGNVGIGIAPVTKLDVSGGVRIGMELASCSVSYAGTLRYNAGNVEYCDGSTWTAFGAATVGVTSLNGSASQTQTFAIGAAGNAPAFNTSSGIHTLNIPLASATGSVTAGLISNADYLNFSNKVNATSAAVISALGYTPASATALGSYLLRTSNLSDLTSSATARTNLGLGTFATASTIDLGTASATGTLAIARLPAFTGDATSTSGSSVLTLASIGAGVTSGSQYTKVTVDGKGRVVSGASLSSADVASALGFTPAPSSSSTQWLNNGSTIYYTSGNVGIGTSSTAAPLQVKATTASTANTSNVIFRVDSYPSGGTVDRLFEVAQDMGADATNTSAVLRMGNGFTNTAMPDEVQIHTAGDSWFNGGNIGFGTTAPQVANHFYKSTTMGSVGSLNVDNSIVRIQEAASASLNIDGNTIVTDNNLYLGTKNAHTVQLFTSETVRVTISNTGNVGVGVNPASAKLHLTSGSIATAPLKFTSGTLTTTPQAGAVEFDGTDFYVTDSTNTRRTIATEATAGTLDNVSVVSSTSGITLWPAAGNSVTVSATTASTNSSTGALIVKGGLGVAGNIYSSGTIVTSSNIQGSEITATSATITPYVYGSTASGGSLRLESTTHATKGNVLLASGGGNVGVNISNPSSPLHVQGSAGSATVPWMTLEGGGSTLDNVALRLFDRGSASVNNNSLEFAHLGAGSVPVATARVRSLSSGSLASSGSSLILETASDASGTWNTSQFVLNRNGAVGIGTSSPNYLMDLYGSASPTLRIRSASNDPASGPTIRLTEDLSENGGFVRYHSLNNSLDLGVIESAAETAVLSMNRTTGKVTMNAVSGTGLLVDLDARTTGDSELLLQADGDDSNENDNPFVHFKQDNNQIHGYLGLVGNPGDGFNFNILDSASNAMVMNSTSAQLQLATSNTVRMTITQSGYTGIGVSTPTARLQVMAGSTGAAPIKMTAGTLLTTPQSGAFEYDGTDFYVTDSSNTRRTIATATTAGTLDNVTVVSSPSGIALWPAAGNSVTVSATTASTNSSTGALIVKGGMGIAGDIYSSGTIVTSSNIQGSVITATSATITPYVYGSTLSSGSLYLESTTHATKGNILLATGGGNVGIGTAAPSAKLQVVGDLMVGTGGASAGTIYNVNLAGGGASPVSGRLTFGSDATNWNFRIARNVAGAVTDLFNISKTGGVGIGSTYGSIQSPPANGLMVEGNVGIGVTNPGFKLDVSGTANVTSSMSDVSIVSSSAFTMNYRAHDGSSDFGGIGLLNSGANRSDTAIFFGDDNTESLRFVNVRSASPNYNLVEHMRLTYDGRLGLGTASPTARLHIAEADDTWASSIRMDRSWEPSTDYFQMMYDYEGLKIRTMDDDSDANIIFKPLDSEAMRISDDGNVGIGTTTPTTNLDIVESQNTDTTINIRNINTGTSARSGFTLTNSGTAYGSDSAGLFLMGTGHSNGEKISLFSNSGIASGIEIVANAATAAITFSTQGTERMRVSTDGNIGIGTSAPTTPLHIQKLYSVSNNNEEYGSFTNVQFNETSTNWKAGIRVNASAANTTGTLSRLVGVQSLIAGGGSGGTVTDAHAFWARVDVAAGQATTNAAGLFVSESGGVGTPVNNYGVYVAPLARGTSTNYAIYTEGASRSYFGGNVGIGVPNATSLLQVNGAALATAWNTSSDKRLKENIKPIENPISKVLQLRGVEFDWRKDVEAPTKHDETHDIGVIAQEVEKVFPEAVTTPKTGYKSVSYSKLVAPLIEAVKSLYYRIIGVEAEQAQQARAIASVEKENAELKARVEKTEKENAELKQRLDRIEKILTNSNTK